ncbi:MAG: DNA cytosine methyltransferase [Burkholderiales bacterium]
MQFFDNGQILQVAMGKRIATVPNAVSLFSGCGGSDLGLERAGFVTLIANDVLPYAKLVYQANMPDTEFLLGNVADIRHFPPAELLAGCYPCQGFSQGGVRDPARNINYLYREFDRALRAIRPKAFIVENVSGMVRTNYSHLLTNQVTRFRSAGYRVKWAVLNAKDYGVAQNRKRIFIVGIRSNLGVEFEFPEPTHGEGRPNPIVTQKDVIADLPDWPKGEFDEHDFHWYYLSRDRRSEWDEPSKTIVSNYRHVPLHPSSPKLIKFGHNDWRFATTRPARRLSYREAARLQGFHPKFQFPDASLVKKFEVIGNAVPPPLFFAVANALPNVWD